MNESSQPPRQAQQAQQVQQAQQAQHARHSRPTKSMQDVFALAPRNIPNLAASVQAVYMARLSELTPQHIVEELDQHVVGQTEAKRTLAVALRNRWRRTQMENSLSDEMLPKHMMIFGSTGTGKTELGRRFGTLVGKMASLPFVRVEATKFTETGYVGRDVESIVRDVLENTIKMLHDDIRQAASTTVEQIAYKRVADLLLVQHPQIADGVLDLEIILQRIRTGIFDEKVLLVDTLLKTEMRMEQPTGQNGHKMRVGDVRVLLCEQIMKKYIDVADVEHTAISWVERMGIVLIDEIDKIAGTKEGVQREILTLMDGTSVQTKYGLVHTKHFLFILAGAFSTTKLTALLPELRGRLAIRVEMKPLSEEDLVSILREPKDNILDQYRSLLAVDGVQVQFTDDGIRALAWVAAMLNREYEDMGARRLQGILELLLVESSFYAPQKPNHIRIDATFIAGKTATLLQNLANNDVKKYV